MLNIIGVGLRFFIIFSLNFHPNLNIQLNYAKMPELLQFYRVWYLFQVLKIVP